MLITSLITLLMAVPLSSTRITPSLFNRITAVALAYSALLSLNALHGEALASGVGIYSGLFQVTTVSLGLEVFLLFTGSLLLLSWAPVGRFTTAKTTFVPTISEYSLMVLFTLVGATLLISSSDLVSLYLSIELQSFAVYIMATLYRDSESATAAGLKYFLLGGLSSALILLGSALVYSYTGVTQLEAVYSLVSVPGDDSYVQPLVLGLVLIGIGLLFKVAASPFHHWAPDVYNGVPTVVTSWLTTMPKISLFVFLLELQSGLQGSSEAFSFMVGDDSVNAWKNLLLGCSLLSLIIGTVVGLSQYSIKRLLAYSTISHVGFLLLGLSLNTQESIEAFLFYLVQYSLTNVATFMVLLALGYTLHAYPKADIQFIKELSGQFKANPLLALSLALCLFSMAGIPPLIGFFAKYKVLYSATQSGYYFITLVAILVSVISASYYLKIVKVMFLDPAQGPSSQAAGGVPITSLHSLVIASLTMVLTLYVLQPSILLNSCHLLALSLFHY